MFVLDWVDDGKVAAQSGKQNAISRRNHHGPERNLRQPEATQELIIDAVTVQSSYARLDS